MARISEITYQNPWWTYGREFVSHDQHFAEAKGRPIFFSRKHLELDRGDVHVLRGSRQVGKTVYLKEMVRQLIESGVNPRYVLYLSLDFFTSRREARNAIGYFIDSTREANEVHLFLDEITSLPDWNLELKYLADLGITKKAKIMATGSSAMGLKKRGELLPGRGLEGNEYYIKPLSCREFALQIIGYLISHTESPEFRQSLARLQEVLPHVWIDLDSSLTDIRNQLEKIIPFKKELAYLFGIYAVTGGFPSVINHYLEHKADGNETIDTILAEVFVRYVLGDLANLNKQELFARQLLREIADKYGSRYSFSRLARNIDSTHVTTIDYLESLEQSFVLSIFYPYDFNKKAPKFKAEKKVYFLDPFIYHSLSSCLLGKELWPVVRRTLEDEESLGKLVEGIVCSHLSMAGERPYSREARTFLWFYYDHRGREIDAVVRTDSTYLGCEVKYRRNIAEEDAARIPQVDNYLLLTQDDVGGDENLLIWPTDAFLPLLRASDRNI